MKRVLCCAFLLMTLISSTLSANDGILFKENKGQWANPVSFRMATGSSTLYVEGKGFTYVVYDNYFKDQLHEQALKGIDINDEIIPFHAYKVAFNNANTAKFEKISPADHYENYFIGNDESKWASHVLSYKEVVMKDLYDGIDARLYSEGSYFKYDWVVAPGGNTDDIEMEYQGLENIDIVDGDLILKTSVYDIIEECPYAFQIIDGRKQQISCNYKLKGDAVTFDFPEGYDNTKVLYIDPVVIASTASGGGTNYGHSATYDFNGNIYAGGRTNADLYPVTVGSFQQTFGGSNDVTIAKFNPDGSALLWATYIGGDLNDVPHSLIVNDDNELYMYGNTASANYPTTSNAYDQTHNGDNDICITVLSSNGANLIGSTYIGGSNDEAGGNLNYINFDDNYRGEIFLGDDDNVYVSGYTQSTDFPVSASAYQTTNAGSQDGVVLKMNSTLSSLVWATYLGGSEDDAAYGMRIDDNENVIVTGPTSSLDFPVSVDAFQTTYGGGSEDGFVTTLSSNGTNLINSTYYGTTVQDASFLVDLDNSGNVCIYGQTKGNTPITAGTYSNIDGEIFITKFASDLESIITSTRLFEGNAFGYPEAPTAFLVDECDNIYISGYNAIETGLDTTPDALYTTGGFHILVMEPDMANLLFATYYSGDKVDGGTSRFDERGIIYQAVTSTDGTFNTLPTAYAANTSTDDDMCVFKIDLELSGVIARIGLDPEDEIGCTPLEVSFGNLSSNALTYEWDFGDGSAQTNDFEPTHTYTTSGNYTIRLIAENFDTCNGLDTAYANVIVTAPNLDVDYGPSEICVGKEVSFNDLTVNVVDPIVEWNWNFGDGNTSDEQNPVHAYENAGTYTISITITTQEGCQDTEIISNAVLVTTFPAEFDGDREVCIGTTVNFTDLSITPPDLDWGRITGWDWDFGDGNTSEEQNPSHLYENVGLYDVTLRVQTESGCEMIRTIPGMVGIYDLRAAFISNQTELTNFSSPEVEFYNNSTGDVANYEWAINGEVLYTTENMTHTFPTEPGEYFVTLTVIRGDCEDSDYKIIKVKRETTLFLPTAFSPNGDGTNEIFIPQGDDMIGSIDFEFEIYDRWGKRVFRSDDPSRGWGGFVLGGGEKAAQGVYIWTVNFQTRYNDIKTMKGTVTLLR